MTNKYMTNFIAMNTANPNNIISSAGSVMVKHAMFAASKVIVGMAIHSRMPNEMLTAQQELDYNRELLGKTKMINEKKLSESATMRPNLSYDQRDTLSAYIDKTTVLLENEVQRQQLELNNYNNRGLINLKKGGVLKSGGILSKERRR